MDARLAKTGYAWLVCCWVILLLVQLIAGCGFRGESAKTSLSPFTITNLVEDPAAPPDWVIVFTNGTWWTVGDSKMSMHVGLDCGVSVTFNTMTRAASKIVIELPASDDSLGQWVGDVNGDGVPDQRRIKGADGMEIFYRGDWVPYAMDGTNGFATLGGRRLQVRYVRGRWEVQE